MEVLRKYGYVRVSSKSQEGNSSLEGQKQEFMKRGVLEKNIWIETASAAEKISDRPILDSLINEELRENALKLIDVPEIRLNF